METVLNVVIADGNDAFAESLKSTLEQNGGFSVVGISGDGEVVLDTMLRTRADILILDPMLTGNGDFAKKYTTKPEAEKTPRGHSKKKGGTI